MFRKPHKFIFIQVLSIAVMMSGCMVTTVTIGGQGQYPDIRVNAILALNEKIHMPEHTASINIQGGKIVRQFSMNQYAANCRLEMYKQSSEPRVILPDDFTIIRVATSTEYVSLQPRQYASIGIVVDADLTLKVYATTLYLKSERQPDVELISCQHWEDESGFPKHLTVKQIVYALGDMFTLKNP